MTTFSPIPTLYDWLIDRPVQRFIIKPNRSQMESFSANEKRIVYQQAVFGWLTNVFTVIAVLYFIISIPIQLFTSSRPNSFFNSFNHIYDELALFIASILGITYLFYLIYILHGYCNALIMYKEYRFIGPIKIIASFPLGKMFIERGHAARVMAIRSVVFVGLFALLFLVIALHISNAP